MKRIGYGQVEPNHLSAQYTGQIYAQLPAMTYTAASGDNPATTTPIQQLENGQFLKYNYANGRASIDGDGEWLLVFNEVKLYDERKQGYKDFAMKASDMADKTIYPRLLRIEVGDIFTTNTFKSTTATAQKPSVVSGDEEITMADLDIGNYVVVGTDGWLTKSSTKPGTGMVFQVVPHFTQVNGDAPAAAYTTVNSEAVYNYYLSDMQDAVKLQRIQ